MMIYCDSKHAELETCCDLPNGPVSQMEQAMHIYIQQDRMQNCSNVHKKSS